MEPSSWWVLVTPTKGGLFGSDEFWGLANRDGRDGHHSYRRDNKLIFGLRQGVQQETCDRVFVECDHMLRVGSLLVVAKRP